MQGRADKGLIITTGTFTSEARREATRDGDSLCLLMKDLGLGVDVKEVRGEEVSFNEEFFGTL